MSTFMLIVVIGTSGFSVGGFSSKATCEKAAQQMVEGFPQHHYIRSTCIEVN